VNNNLGISPSQLGQVHAPPRSGGAAPPVPSSEAQRADSVVLTGGAGSSAEPVAATEASAAALLQQEYARRFPGASSEQCAELASLFGDRFPRYHQTSPSGQKSLFWIPPGAPDQPFGLYRLDCGHGSPQPALDRECAQTLLQPPRSLNPGERPHPRDRRTPSERAQATHRPVRHLAWQPGERRVALTYERGGFGDGTIMVDFEGSSHLLPGRRTYDPGSLPTLWSPDGRWLALQSGDAGHVYFYDAETSQQLPQGYAGKIVRWKGINLEVQVGDDLRLVMFQKQSAHDAAGGLLGDGRQQEAGSVRSGRDEVQIGDVRLPIRRQPREA